MRRLFTEGLAQADGNEDDLPNVRLIDGDTTRVMTFEEFARDETLGLSALERCCIGAEIEGGFSVEIEDGRRFEPDGQIIDQSPLYVAHLAEVHREASRSRPSNYRGAQTIDAHTQIG